MEDSQRPNVLIVIPHDLGTHLGCYGQKAVNSPNLDKFAESGARFTEFFTTAPECCASRASLFTGLFPHQHGQMGLTHFGWEPFPESRHMAQYLSSAGYQTHLFGLQHITAGDPARLGFQHVHAERERSSQTVCSVAADFIQQLRPGDPPWFAQIGLFQVHRGSGWRPPRASDLENITVPPYLPDNDTARREFSRFHQSIEEMDQAFGTVVNALEESGTADNTLVVFVTDHGIGFPHAKSTFYDPGIRISLLIRWPNRCKGGCVYEDLLSNLDVLPTILEACGIEPPDALPGRSFLPLLDGAEYDKRTSVSGAVFYDVAYDPMHYIRTDRFKYIRSFGVDPEDTEGAAQDMLPADGTGVWIRMDDLDVQNGDTWKTIEGPHSAPPREELYDLESDPLEFTNLADNPEYEHVLNELRALLQEMMVQSDSPLLQGHVDPNLSSTRNLPMKR